MRRILTIARYEYTRHVPRRGFLFTALGIPLLFAGVIALIVLVISRSPVEQQLGFVDRTGHITSPNLPAPEPNSSIPMQRFDDEDAARRAFDARAIDAYVVIPADYLQTGQVRAVSRRELSRRASEQVEAVLRQGLLNAVPPKTRAAVDEPMELSLRTLDTGREVQSANLLLFLLPYVFALIFFVTTFTTSGFLLQSVVEEKEDRVIEIIATTVSPTQLMAGKIIGLTSVGLTQVSIWIGLAALAVLAFIRRLPFLASLQLPWAVLALGLLYFLLGYLLIAACYAAAGAIVTTSQEAQTLVTPLSMLGIAPLMLVNVILTQPNGTLALIFSLIPFSAPMTMLLRLPVADVPPWQVTLSLLTLALAAFGAVLLSARALRMSIAHSGRRLTLRDLARQA